MFVYDLKSRGYIDKEKGQTLISEDLSALAPHTPEILNIRNDFKKVIEFIDANKAWLQNLIKKLFLKFIDMNFMSYSRRCPVFC